MTRLKEKWQEDLALWQTRRVDDLEVVYCWVDGIYVKAGLEKEKTALLVVGDGHLGIWKALRHVYPEAEEPHCWNHKIVNVLDKLPKRQHVAGTGLLRQIPAAPTRREAERWR